TCGRACTGGGTPVPYRRSWPGRLVPGEVDELREACSERTVFDEVPHVGPREVGHAIAPVGDADVVTMERGALFAADSAGLEEQRVGRVRRRRAHCRLAQRTRRALSQCGRVERAVGRAAVVVDDADLAGRRIDI